VLPLSNGYLLKQLDHMKKIIIDDLIQQTRRRVSRMSLWNTWSDVWDMMVLEEGLTRTWPRWTMHRRRPSGSLHVEVPDVMEKGKWMFNLRNQASLEEWHISKCQYLLNQDMKWLWDQKWKLIIRFEVSQVKTSRRWCQSKNICGNPHEVKEK
jgi:hypothetical protein